MRHPSLPAWLRAALALFATGWGANHFAALLPVYRADDGLSQTVVTSLFAAYVLGLIPALLLAAVVGRRVGHRLVIRWVLVGAVCGSAVLALADGRPTWLLVGRVLYGACMGAAMAPGTTWVKELSADAPTGTGARRAAIAMSAGFGGGPLVSGALAQWAPLPHLLPYAVHIALAVVVAVLVWNAPQPGEPAHGAAHHAPGPVRTLAFWTRIAPTAPGVFTCASVGIVVVPSLVHEQTRGLLVAFTGLAAGLTLGTGVLVQQPARRLAAHAADRVSLLGGAAAVVGIAVTAALAARPSIPLAMVGCVVLGAGYGLVLVGGLTRVEQQATPSALAMTNAVFYSLTYLGFFVPTFVSVLGDRWSLRTVLLGFAGLAAGCTMLTAIASRHERRVATVAGAA
ncbi:MFS transporter [Luteipulveratus sp. YIM 133132]|uniref:MFS transporter n=1 Tax=Luteipulveratus flavus TaxID=3031728 RepID=UPI0023AFF338|nr:MFS transporter [Luteipulveratus sp. YIM 133132]MDE9365206.1 MFS transporter [Luteipulveratus sp. YIM 133132]